MSKAASMVFALVAYAIFFATFLYLIAFVGNLGPVPVTIDHGPDSPVGVAVVIDIALIALFGIQHSVMARQGFKRMWTRIVPEPAERSVYVLAASVALMILFAFWRPIAKRSTPSRYRSCGIPNGTFRRTASAECRRCGKWSRYPEIYGNSWPYWGDLAYWWNGYCLAASKVAFAGSRRESARHDR